MNKYQQQYNDLIRRQILEQARKQAEQQSQQAQGGK